LYSIASSPDANPDEAHLTVAIVNYEKFSRQHWGSASNFLIGDTTHAPIYVEPNDHFRLPQDGATPIIMVGAGTGVAPFRAFVEHRREHGHSGQNWLVFGDRNISSDFLYQLEWLRYRKDGLLRNLDVAFSRDQDSKIYVQHRLLERGKSIYGWLESGAHFYVCGDAKHMAGDVQNALLSIIRQHGGMNAERAREYVNDLKRTRRYQRDVY
jgi:sulfite reductase (NADPH) flavoprotein alpha-component